MSFVIPSSARIGILTVSSVVDGKKAPNEVEAVDDRAEARQLLHSLDDKLDSANQQQFQSLLSLLRELDRVPYAPVENLKMPKIVPTRGRPKGTKRLPLAVELASQDFKKKQRTKKQVATPISRVSEQSANAISNASHIVDDMYNELTR
jgi:hypothetical protein